MKVQGIATTQYPSQDSTNHAVLFDSLGSFWTHIFTDRGVIRGLSVGQAEELIQRYYELVDAVASLSAKDIPALHTERWLPIKLRRSQVVISPLRFLPEGDQDVAYFGPQPPPIVDTPTDTRNCRTHCTEVFQFGRAKRPFEKTYETAIDPSIKVIPVLADRILAPTAVLTHGVEFELIDGKVYFNVDPFNLKNVARYPLFDSSGNAITFQYKTPYYAYADEVEAESSFGVADGTILPEEEIVLWAYHGEVDADALYNNFGYIFDIRDTDPLLFKRVLEKMVNLLVEGPTIGGVTGLASAFLGIEAVKTAREVVKDAYEVDGLKFVVTDKNVYQASSFYNFSNKAYFTPAAGDPTPATPRFSAVVYEGDQLFDAVQYYDQLVSPSWWKIAGLVANQEKTKMAFPPCVFIGSYSGVLIFENRSPDSKTHIDYVVQSLGGGQYNIRFPFPAEVSISDAEIFNQYLEDHSATTVPLLQHHAGFNAVGADHYVNPLDFIFTYFFQTNSALIKLRFQSAAQTARFLRFFQYIQPCLPKHVYLLFYFDFPLTVDTARILKNAVLPGEVGGDGSDYRGVLALPPQSSPFGIPENTSDTVSQLVIGKSLDLHTADNAHLLVYTSNLVDDGLGGVTPAPVVQDRIIVSNFYTEGVDINNLPLAYRITGNLDYVAGTTTLTGIDTIFLRELKVNDMIYDATNSAGAKEYRTITEITNNTSLKISSAFSGANRTIPLWVARQKPSMRNTSSVVFWPTAA